MTELTARFVVDGWSERAIDGLESSPDTWFGHIVPHSGTGDFARWSVSARVVHDDEGPYFVFVLD